jgi:hypothetical protein
MAFSSKALDAVCVNFYASASASCKSKHNSVSSLIQPYIDALQKRLDLPSLNYNDMTEIGGSPTTNNEDITKWWFVFWEGQPEYWFGLKKSNGEDYDMGNLERYMLSVKNQLTKKFSLSRYLNVIKGTYNTAHIELKSMVKTRNKASGVPPKNKIYTSDDVTFILQGCLWFDSAKYIDFLVFQTLLLRLCSRATETSALKVQNISFREVCDGAPPIRSFNVISSETRWVLTMITR